MNYELVLLIHPDVSMGQMGEVVKLVSEVIKKAKGSIVGSEYWGFRTLAYRIEKRGKAHYVFLGITMEEAALADLYHHLRFSRDIIRFLLTKRPEGFVLPTPLYHSDLQDAIAGVGPSSPVASRSAPEAASQDAGLEDLPEGGEAHV